MAVNFRSVSQLEAVTSLADDDKILVVQDGTAKAIKKSDAKFGGGTTTVYNIVENTSTQSADNGAIAVQATAGTSNTYTLQNADGSEVTAQEVYNAFVIGRVLLSQSVSGNSLVATQKSNDSSVNVLGVLFEVTEFGLYGNSIDSIVGVVVCSKFGNITIGNTGNN